MKGFTLFGLILLFIFTFYSVKSQVVTDPLLPVASQKVTVTFDSSEETRLGYFTGELYAHTGVMIEGKNDWQHVIGSWGNNTLQPQLTNKGNGIYELEISPDISSYYSVSGNEKVLKLAFVFRSADGTKQTNDLFVTVYQEGLVVEIATPAHKTIVNKGQTIAISANSSIASSLKLSLNETLLNQTQGTSISTSKTFNESGNFWIIAEATSGETTLYDSAYICVKENIVSQTKPNNYQKGINYLTDSTAALVLWAPEKEFVFVLGDFNNWLPNNEFQMKKDGDFFWLDLNNLTKGQEYIFQYFIDNKILVADPYAEKISDPWNDKNIPSVTYPGLISYPEGKTEGIASVLQPGQENYQWEISNFSPPEKEKMVIYELLIRDFTSDHSYQGVIDNLDYLEDLEINVLELMPVNEFEGNSSWGYNPAFYFAPDKYYGPKNDLKKLIDECHKRGIAVVIDMVLNHSYGQSPFVQMYMDNWTVTSDNPWHNVEHNFQNTAAHWGYDFNHESEATRELIDSINTFWLMEYKVDGFRFDFTKGFSNTTYGPSSWGSTYDAARIANLKRMATKIREKNNNAIIIFEHLADNSEETVLANDGILLWGNMNHNYGEAAMGYTTNSDLSNGLFTQRNWDEPNLVTYMESHDEERLTYKCLQFGKVETNYSVKTLPIALERMALNAVFMIPLPGPKMIWQFGERGYDFSIDAFGGRLNEKPPHWDYLNDSGRTDLFRIYAQLNSLKKTYEEFSPQVMASDLSGEIKWYRLNSGSNHVFIIGNFSTQEKSATVTFPVLGTWFEHFTNSTLSVETLPQTFILSPGEYQLYSTRQFEKPDIATDIQISEQPENILSVYPNPANAQITIDSKNPFSKIHIHSLSGKTILIQKYKNLHQTHINIADYSPGIYFIKIYLEKTVRTKKIVVN